MPKSCRNIAIVFGLVMFVAVPVTGQDMSSSKSLNDRGCDEMMKQNYASAEQLFSAALTAAQRANDQKRMITSLTNLRSLYEITQRLEQAKQATVKIEAVRNAISPPIVYGVMPRTSALKSASSFSQTSARPNPPAQAARFPGSRANTPVSIANRGNFVQPQNPAVQGLGHLKLIEFYADW
jgi:hypothetical protein